MTDESPSYYRRLKLPFIRYTIEIPHSSSFPHHSPFPLLLPHPFSVPLHSPFTPLLSLHHSRFSHCQSILLNRLSILFEIIANCSFLTDSVASAVVVTWINLKRN